MTTAIDQSASNQITITIRAIYIDIDDLCEVADDWVAVPELGFIDVWGTTEYGLKWRIRILTEDTDQ